MTTETRLNRSLSLPLLTFYGLGTIIGAGIYVLVGEVANIAGMYAPISFLVASIVAGFTAFSYAELSARFPKSAGEAIYIQEGFNVRYLSMVTGLLIILVGIVSCATLANGFVNYLNEFFLLPHWLVLVVLILLLGCVAAWGITQSVTIAFVLTLIEIGGLLLIIWVAGDSLVTLPERLPEMIPTMDFIVWQGIFFGGFLAFYAFVGFEDMVNVAEEVKNPTRNLPFAIIIALVVSSLLYLAVSTVAVLSMPPQELAGGAPLVKIYEQATGKPAFIITLIGLLSLVNGILVQIIMASRILYGMSFKGWLPSLFCEVNTTTKTPLFSTVLVSLIVLFLAVLLPLVTLAKITSFITLLVFFLVNVALFRIKQRDERDERDERDVSAEGIRTVPLFVPVAGALLTITLVLIQLAGYL